MPIDTSIYGNIQQYKAPDQLNQLAQLMQVQGLQRDNQLGQLKMDEYQRGVEDDHAMRADLSSGTDPYQALLKRGKVKEAGAFMKDKAATDKDSVEVQNKTIAMYRDASQAITDPQSAIEFVTHMHTDPRLKDSAVARIPLEAALKQIPQDPAQLPAWKQQFALGASKFMELNAPKTNVVNTGGTTQMVQTPGLGGAPTVAQTFTNTQTPDNVATNETSRANNAATVGATIRGQNLTDARSREANSQGKTQIVETPNGFVLVDKNTGQSRPAVGSDGQPLKGKANDRVMTDSQAKANLFGTRMQEADRILNSLEGKYSPGAVNARKAAADIPVVGGITGYAANLAASSGTQQAEQAQRDFINAVLRRESGAAIAPSEFQNANQQYFPQPGDGPEVKAQKARNRALAISGMQAEVPGGFRTSPSLTSAGSTGGATGDFGGGANPQIEDLLKKYGGH